MWFLGDSAAQKHNPRYIPDKSCLRTPRIQTLSLHILFGIIAPLTRPGGGFTVKSAAALETC
jgi:hypothetical protein